MPIYEYECDSCKQRFEVQQSIQDAPLVTCPQCSGSVHRVFSPNMVIFKGSGFYSTDHRKSKPPETDTSTSETAAASS